MERARACRCPMSSSEQNIPDPEASAMLPEEAHKVAAEIRAVAESRGEDSEVVDLIEAPVSGRARRATLVPPMPTIGPPLAVVETADDELSALDLRDAWPLLDLEERSDGLRVLPREDA